MQGTSGRCSQGCVSRRMVTAEAFNCHVGVCEGGAEGSLEQGFHMERVSVPCRLGSSMEVVLRDESSPMTQRGLRLRKTI